MIKKIINNHIILHFFYVVPIPLLVILSNNFDNYFALNEILLTYLILLSFYLFILLFFKSIKKFSLEKSIIITSVIYYIFFLFGLYNKITIRITNFFFEFKDYDLFLIIRLIFFIISFLIFVKIFIYFYQKIFIRILSVGFLSVFLFNTFNIITKNSNQFLLNDKNFNADYFLLKNGSIDIHKFFDYPKIKMVNFSHKPNVYFFLFDMYSNEKYLNEIYPNEDLNLSKFFKQNNFIISANTFSNYSHSYVAMPSIYFSNYFTEVVWKNLGLLGYFSNKLSKEKNGIDLFKFNKYNIIFSYCVGEYTKKQKNCYKQKDFSYLFNLIDISFFDAVLEHSPIKNMIYIIAKIIYKIDLNENSYEKRGYLIQLEQYSDILNAVNIDNNRPNFFFIHFQLPHPPYFYDENCNFKKIPKDEVTGNNMLMSSDERRKTQYLDSLKCSNNTIMNITKKILATDDDPIILFFSDHGAHLFHEKDGDIDYIDIEDIYGSLVSLKTNNDCLSNVNEKDVFQANLFRIVSNCLSKEKNEILPFKLFYKNFHNINDQIKILNRELIESIKNNNVNEN